MKKETSAAGRRLFLRQSVFAFAGIAALPSALLSCAHGDVAPVNPVAASGVREGANWRTRIGTDAEPGEPLTVSGTIYASDGRTPLEGATFYVYHTDARGLYSDVSGDPRESARLRGRMLTGRDGRYEFLTIKPAPYPGGAIPAHIHVSLTAPGAAERWITDYWFEGDPLLSRSERERNASLGAFSPLLRITRDGAGVLLGSRDIKVG